MKLKCVLVAGALMAGLSGRAFCWEFSAIRVEPQELQWRAMGEGVQYAPVSGSEHGEDMYVYRVTFPKGHKSVPHTHTDSRVITILQGSLYVGYGKEFDESKLKRLSAGSVFTELKNKPHYMWSKDEAVLIQVTGNGASRRIVTESEPSEPSS